MQIVIDYYSNAPIYEQVVEQIKLQIFKGDIPPCSIMPSIRAFAVELKVSVITIKKIYEILEREGYIVTIPQRGSFVTENPSELFIQEKRREVRERQKDLINYALKCGIAIDEIKNMIKMEMDLYD